MESGPLFVERMFYLKNVKEEGTKIHMIWLNIIIVWVLYFTFRCCKLDSEKKVKRITIAKILWFWKHCL